MQHNSTFQLHCCGQKRYAVATPTEKPIYPMHAHPRRRGGKHITSFFFNGGKATDVPLAYIEN